MSGKMSDQENRNKEQRKNEMGKGPSHEAYKGTMEQNKCTVCGRTFSNHSELKDHYKSAHNMEAPEKIQGRDDSSIRGQTENRGEEEKTGMDEEHEMTEGSSEMGTQETRRMALDRESDKIKADTTMGKGHGTETYPKTQNQYTCQRCGEKCASQAELDRHNKEVHGVEPGKMEEKTPKAKY